MLNEENNNKMESRAERRRQEKAEKKGVFTKEYKSVAGSVFTWNKTMKNTQFGIDLLKKIDSGESVLLAVLRKEHEHMTSKIVYDISVALNVDTNDVKVFEIIDKGELIVLHRKLTSDEVFLIENLYK